MPSQYPWGPEGPPEEAYSRVTDPERFLPLHDAALKMLAALEQRFDVERVEGYGLDDELATQGLIRPTVVLRPTDPGAAPITVAFTDFPGLNVRFGRWSTEPFPSCGCDACAEDAEGETERLTEMVDILTAGGFREAVIHSPAPWMPGWWRPDRLLQTLRRGRAPGVMAFAPLSEQPRQPSRRLRLGTSGLRGSRLRRWFDGPTHRSRSGSLIADSRALEMSGGRRRLDLNWKPWPERQPVP
ncbi:MAG: DUF6226 family protein [Chloroflexi bacterium]|nr:DUF6226 family protein [Chloroflexota bacterium]